MKSDVETQVAELLDIDNQNILLNKVAEITDQHVLHLLGRSYNWDDGFAVPEAIINNPNCCLSTALELFYLADGARYLKDKLDVEQSALGLWKHFVIGLYEQIIQGRFERNGIGFKPPLSKVEIYKLKKNLEPSEYIFIEVVEEENLTL